MVSSDVCEETRMKLPHSKKSILLLTSNGDLYCRRGRSRLSAKGVICPRRESWAMAEELCVKHLRQPLIHHALIVSLLILLNLKLEPLHELGAIKYEKVFGGF